MTNNQTLVFGDIVKNISNETFLVAVSGAISLNKNKRFILFLEMTKDYNCLNTQLLPKSREEVDKFLFIDNVDISIEKYLIALNIKYNISVVEDYGFKVKKRKNNTCK